MKRSVLIIIIAGLFGTTMTHAQALRSYGVKGGLTMANQRYEFTTFDYRMETKPVFRPAIGLFAELFHHEYLSVQADLIYAGKGSKTSTTSITVNHLDNDNVTVNEGPVTSSSYHYASFSPMIRYRNEDIFPVLYVMLGPRFEKLIAYNTQSDYPLDDQNTTMFGLTGSFGAEFSLGELDAFVELQYQPDMTPVTDELPLLVRNSIVMLTVGVRFMQ